MSCGGIFAALERPFDVADLPKAARPRQEPAKQDVRDPNLKMLKELLEPYLLTEDTRVVEQNREEAFKQVLLSLASKKGISVYYHVPFAVQYSAGQGFAITPDFFIPELRWQPPRSDKRFGPNKTPMCVVFEPHDYPRSERYAQRSISRMEAFHKTAASEIFFVLAGSKSKETLERENERFKLRKVANELWLIPNGDTEFKDVKRAVKKRVSSLIRGGNCQVVKKETHTDETLSACFAKVKRGTEIMRAGSFNGS
jgi:hypothetical protein